MTDSMPVLVAPSALSPRMRAPTVAAAIGRGLERAGVPPPELCPVAGGGAGIIEVLLPALGGETASARVRDAMGREIVAGFALVDGGGTAIVEAAVVGDGASSCGIGQLVVEAIAAGSEVVVLACGGAAHTDGGAGAISAIERGGGLRGAALVALSEQRPAPVPTSSGATDPSAGAALASSGATDPSGGAALASALRARLGAHHVHGATFVLEELGFDARMRTARAVVVADAALDAGLLAGRVSGEIAIRARQAGIPCHAVGARAALEPFDVRILDLQAVLTAGSVAELEAAGEQLVRYL
jgi:glycerate kinase